MQRVRTEHHFWKNILGNSCAQRIPLEKCDTWPVRTEHPAAKFNRWPVRTVHHVL